MIMEDISDLCYLGISGSLTEHDPCGPLVVLSSNVPFQAVWLRDQYMVLSSLPASGCALGSGLRCY